MKTLTKILSVLIVVVMCVSLFGANAYAIDLFSDPQDAGGVDLFDEPAAEGGSDGSVDLFGEPEQPVQPAAPSQPQGGVDLQIGEFEGNDDLQMNAASGSVATVGKVACKDAGEINAALANGGSTVTVITGKTVSGEIIINRAATIDLNGGTISGTITVNSSLTIKDSSGGSGCCQAYCAFRAAAEPEASGGASGLPAVLENLEGERLRIPAVPCGVHPGTYRDRMPEDPAGACQLRGDRRPAGSGSQLLRGNHELRLFP